MSAGAPVLMTSNFGCIGDLATNGETAIIVPPQDPQRLADEMIRLLLSPVLRQELSARALELISGWHVEHQAKRLAEIWRGIAQGVT
jgi:glycosyltransferase involved in cell wall biosynthesis